MKEYKTLTCEIKDGVAVVTMNRPPLNLLTYTLLQDLWNVIDELDADKDMRAVVLTGEGRAFCAGMEVGSSDMAPRGYGQLVMMHLDSARLPIIAAINGWCLGGGMELALACDIRLMSEAAKIGMVEATIGYIPAWGGNSRLPWLIGEANAKKLFYTAEKITAEKAKELGIVQDIYPAEDLLPKAKELAAQIAQNAPRSISSFKQVCFKFRESLFGQAAIEETKYSVYCATANDAKEGARALKEKRKPVFKNE